MLPDDYFIVFENATPKQIETLDLAASGLTSKQIARKLHIAPRTVDQRIDAIRSKLDGVPVRVDMIRSYRQWRQICGSVLYDSIPMAQSGTLPAQIKARLEDELQFHDAITFDDRNFWNFNKLWPQLGVSPVELGIVGKVFAMLAGAVVLIIIAVLSVSFSIAVMTLLDG